LPPITTGEWEDEFDEAVYPPVKKPAAAILSAQIVGVFLDPFQLFSIRVLYLDFIILKFSGEFQVGLGIRRFGHLGI
jgi:hypothetical protein